MNKSTRLLLAMIVAIGGLWWYFSDPLRHGERWDPPLTPSPSAKASPLKTATPNPTAGWKKYMNTKLGFKLTLTDAWKNYKVFESELSQGFGAPKLVEFAMPTKDYTYSGRHAGYATVLTIWAYPVSNWNTMDAEVKERSGVYMTKNSQHVFVYTQWQDPPADLISVNFEVPKILSTFKFIE